MGPGMYLYDMTSQQILLHLDLPPGAESPHALAYDGKSLWLGEIVSETIYEIDPADGAVLSTITGVRTEGLAVDGDHLWYSADLYGYPETSLVQIDHNGSVQKEILVSPTVIQDIAFDGASLYYLVNDELDRIVRVDPASGAESQVADHVAAGLAPYALSYDGKHLASIDNAANGNELRRYDVLTGATVSVTPFGVPGWVSAIAFVPAP